MTINTANLLNLDYRSLAQEFLAGKIIDIHTHINQAQAARVYKEVAELFGIVKVFSMTPLAEVAAVQHVLGNQLELIAIPNFHSNDPIYELGEGFLEKLEKFHELGAKIVKFWSAPRGHDMSRQYSAENLFALNTKARIKTMRRANQLNMVFMVHVGDPDTWFATKYKDHRIYGTKLEQYLAFEELLGQFANTWIAAHMGGWPEDLEFLDRLLTTHSNLYLDTSATKWMVRELSKHSQNDFFTFFNKWQDRLLFGSDIVAKGLDLRDEYTPAFDLYASRYWALKTLFETDYQGLSPIVDPDLVMTNPDKYTEHSSANLVGRQLPTEILNKIYYSNAARLLKIG